MSAITREITGDVTSKLGMGMMAAHVGLSNALDGIAERRRRAADSVTELVLRLREARRDQRAALDRAAKAEAELRAAASEVRLLREALVREKRVSSALKELCGVA